MVRYKQLLRVALLLSFLCVFECKRHKKSARQRQSSNENDNPDHTTGIDLFHDIEVINQVTCVNNVWKWKSKSNQLVVHDDVRLQIINSLVDSFSVEFRVKVNRRSKVSLFRATSNVEGSSALKWLDVLLDYQQSAIEVMFMNGNMIPEIARFDLIGSYKTWITIFLTLDNRGRSSISFSSGIWPKQTYNLTGEIHLAFPQDTAFELGGISPNAASKFTGLVRKGTVYIPGLSAIPNTANSRNEKQLSIHKKRGALRKPSLSTETTRPSRHTARTGVTAQNETMMTILREEIQMCKDQQRQITNMLTMLKQSHAELQDKVTYLEACECTRMCVISDRRRYSHGERWNLNECTSCVCNHGVTQCQNDTACQARECDSLPCQNNGVCVELDDGFLCRCRNGFRGDLCEQMDQCARSVCQNGAECDLLPNNDYQCTCPRGYMGKNCDTIDWCGRSPCRNGGACSNRQSGYDCFCRGGYFGDNCENMDWCHQSPCRNGGQCVSERQGYRCTCRRGFIGDDCQYSDLCETSPCMNRGRCSNDVDSRGNSDYICDCPSAYSGKNCEQMDYCASMPCLHGGTCTMTQEGFECQCRSGHIGDNCEERDWCYRSPCQNGGECNNGRQGYRCTCRRGFIGDDCQYSDLCETSPCMNRGRCSNDVDSRGNSDYICDCPSAYSGKNCEQMDYCASMPCHNGGHCTNTADGYECQCRPGYLGRRCEISDRCSAEPCMNGATCINTERGFECRCASDYYGSLCERRNYCSDDSCLNGGVCASETSGFVCRCRQMYFGDRCEYTDYCRANPCLNDGACRNIPYSAEQPFTCDCDDGFTGSVCQTVDVCSSNPCLNGGVCSLTGRSFVCECSPSHLGDRCQRLDYCSRNPCLNGGACHNEERGFQCTCLESHMGRRCENPHPCRNTPCLNGGECTSASDGGYACTCPSTHYGPECDMINSCFSNPCLNGGSCMNRRDGFVCLCRDGFYGDDCSITDLCENNPCQNGGTCQNNNGNVTCICPSTHQGGRCEFQCNICMYLPDQGTTCDRRQANNQPGRRWFYDKFTQSCKSLMYAGCGGNSNNFASRQDCRSRCIVGACCMMQISSDATTTTTMCRTKSLGQCKRINQERNDIQVLSFISGQSCSRDTCGSPDTCMVGGLPYEAGSSVNLGCDKTCMCLDGGVLDCPCTDASVRKEIRQLSSAELRDYQDAIRSIKMMEYESGGNAWDAMRDDYMYRAPIAQSSSYFLLWNRAFLRKMELLLQKGHCQVTIPYYDFTLDAGRFNESVVWQPNYFGGDGECVPDHPFRVVSRGKATKWAPCLVRDFNLSVSIPNMIDVAMAMTSRNLEEFSSSLFHIVSYVRSFIGGDMATIACAYDPLFYSIHAYIDYIFSQWQEKNSEAQFPPASDNIPFGMPVGLLWEGACASYVSLGYLEPCNISNSSPERFGADGFNLQGYTREGFNRRGYDRYGYDAMGRDHSGRYDTRLIYTYDGYNAQGYDRSGLDRRGFSKYGFCNGFNRDGFDTAGYDIDGYNRYGINRSGYDMRGFDIYGVSTSGEIDESGFYDDDTGFSDCCFSRDGLTVSGLDRFGFTAAGYDQYNCNYFFQGPHTLYYQEKLWNALSIQPRSFLVSLLRTCGSLSNPPVIYVEHNWMSNANRLPLLQTSDELDSTFSKPFCIDTEMLLSWCPCLEGNYPAICHINPCHNAMCSLNPGARCHINMCGPSCTAEFFLRGRRVNCEDPCQSNPCANGGTCTPSWYSSASERFKCACVNGFMGALCERQATDTCTLPMQSGPCRGRIRRWYYNQVSRSCEEFVFSGCGGNLNNFPNQKICELRCSVGACCYRRVMNTTQVIGFDRDGYDKYGFNDHGYNRNGRHHSPHNSLRHGNQVLAPKGFGHDGYDIYGYNEQGYDRQGYDREGFNFDTGYNRTGFDRDGRFDQRGEFDRNGLDNNGYNRDGFRCNGLSSNGYNLLGFYKEYEYGCQSLSQQECDAMGNTHEVIRFSLGRDCQDVHCGDKCGCDFNGKLYKFGQSFQHGCQQCTCSLGGTIECICQQLGKRKEIRDLTDGERTLYNSAIRKVYESGQWDYFVGTHSEYMPIANGAITSLPWHRYFLANIERELQKEAGCSVFIPYFDWTTDVGSMNESYVWSAAYFGGNGEQETNCVNHHPFKGLESWHPCIRRNFNASIYLPDAVDIHLLLQEPDFKNFSLKLEAVSALFHLWVGGHMASPFSPYDPVYLSHWAFVDLIWSNWQKMDPKGMSRYPMGHRYTQLKPFDVTPDDVLSTQKQICINYITPTLGAPCNSSTMGRPLKRNDDGFDRHGYDEQGFDIEGFDATGRGRHGQRDNRNIYDRDGYTSDGYQRSGFDSQGWDRYGFNTMGVNRDGIDVDGFDESGYNSYGYDRSGETPYGMYRNGTFAPGSDRGYAGSLFDRFGYNRFGLNSAGLDHGGFSAYGFNLRGYDQDNCNYYNMGPHYMRFFYFGLMQLKILQRNTLEHLDRICPSISTLPLWMADGWLHNSELIRSFERERAMQRMVNMKWMDRTSSVTDDRLWIPRTPDKQFCFDLHMFTGCPVGTPLINCQTDLCSLSRCASQPHAQCRTKNCGSCYPEFFDGSTGEIYTCFGCIDNSGNVHGEATTWEQQCTSCVCQGGMISCTPIMCSTTQCTHPATRPGLCCPTCDVCQYEGSIYRHGQRFQSGDCESCQCVLGSVTCHSMAGQCPQLRCSNPIKRDGECCMACPIGCEGHSEGDEWRMGECHTCRCIRGVMQCAAIPCPSLRCTHPHKPMSSCCPACDGCAYNGMAFTNGQRFLKDACTQCSCNSGDVVCVKQQCPPLQCVNQQTLPDSCCPVCAPGCEYDGNSYTNGEVFHPVGSPCRNCTCQNNRVECTGHSCHSLGTCPRPVKREGRCCPECTDCTYGDRVYRNRQAWTTENGCERCTCQGGNIACIRIHPCEPSCTHGLNVRGQCCSECSRCSFNARMYRDGEVFFNENNPCQRCLCMHGNITCEVIPCPTLQCTMQVTLRGDCCPSCKSCRQGSIEHEHGSSWRLENDACTTCTCREGDVRCATESCENVNCQYPINLPNTCCPSCSGCLYDGMQYDDGDDVTTDDVCRTCKCMKGNVECEREGCEDLSCSSQVTLSGQCCPSCASCTYQQQTYEEGATFVSPRNPCLSCTCEAGETNCHRIDLDCPRLECSNPGRIYGTCCPTCNHCQYERRNYRNGNTFNPPGSSPCLICTCTDGSVSCETDTCGGISCPNPVHQAGQCCPTCEVCVVGDLTYSPGDTWHPDACNTCTCDAGRVTCESNRCPETSCTHPAQLPGRCCLSCDMCLFHNRAYSNGHNFQHPSQLCQTCNCMSGNVLCENTLCERLTCETPVTPRGSCCPTCPSSCVVDDDTSIENGTMIQHPDDRCQICTCNDGILDCGRSCSASPPCRHPTDGDCCRDNCDGCFYRGNDYYNGQTFPHARDQCRTCTCTNGNVRCLRKRCPSVDCRNPERARGSCCPTCPAASTGCDHNGRSIAHEQQFTDECQICTCNNGVVQCRPKTCPSAPCSNPATRDCCRYCGGCSVNGVDYQSGEVVSNPSGNECETCRCLTGDLICARRSCQQVHCTHPISDGCCPSCTGCLYDGMNRGDGDSFESTDNPCDVCACNNGNVQCERRPCGRSNCTHPITLPNSCCPVCGGDCLHENDVYVDGFTFNQASDQCRICSCVKGSILCQAKRCTEVSCRNPTVGVCNCPVCEGCNYNGIARRNRETFTNPQDEQCSECYCQDGNVNCGRRHCRSSACTHPTLDMCDCPLCDNCLYHGETYRLGEEFVDVRDTCNGCVCDDGNVVCQSRVCPEVECINPSIGQCGCPVCLNCNYLGVEYENNENLIDSMNKCNQCICRLGTVQCTLRACPPTRCSNPATPFGECCPKCIGECIAEGEVYQNGATFILPSDVCSSCTCNSGEVRCLKQRCDRSCTHPLSQNECCPDCSGCLYQGRIYEEGSIFTPHNDQCQQCTCRYGNIICQDRHCPVLECSNPRPVRGQCCPECPQELQNGCASGGRMYEVGMEWMRREEDLCSECMCGDDATMSCIAVECSDDCGYPVPVIDRCCGVCDSCFYQNRTYEDGELFHPNTCQDCMCNEGDIQCIMKACRPLTCPINQQVHIDGDCCPRCVSCVMDDHLFAEGEIWTPSSDVCLTCQCHSGVVTCQPIVCVPTCQIMTNIPGQCCPICSSCRFRNEAHEIGDQFEPNPMDPCEICQCMASADGTPSLSCHRVACPSLADCPRSCIKQPEPGECCPTCNNRPECNYGNCNAAIRGQQLHPFDNPCFTCNCNVNKTWECSPMSCRKLDCLPSQQYTPKSSCCPMCDTCRLVVENRDVRNGFTWRLDECQTCHCDRGTITCHGQECQPLNCILPMIPFKHNGQCCQHCVDPNAPCMYEGHSVPSRHRWLVDKCTTCECFAGRITCMTQRCRMLMCEATEQATVIPGECCPRCIPQPANCIAFGDPHFRTFDGRMIHFQGTCRYLLTSDCMKGHFRIEIENTDRGATHGAVSWVDKVFLTLAGHRIALRNNYDVFINGTLIQLPILIQPYLFIDRSSSHILVNTHIGLQLSWNAGQRHLEVNVPATYKRRTCGLCGNFNNYPQDDLRLRNSRMTTSDSTFGNNWKIVGRGMPTCTDVEDLDPCDSLTYSQRKKANVACKVIRSDVFAACHQVVNPEMYFSACVQDACACGENTQFCLCDVLEAYAAQCRRSGVVVRWRTSTFCAIGCPRERGYVFDECGSPCKRSCANRNLPPEDIDRQCYMPCVSGCQCVAGKVEHEGRCINPTLCPDNITTVELPSEPSRFRP